MGKRHEISAEEVVEIEKVRKRNLVCDGVSWHKANALVIPQNIRLIYLPPAAPEMNPIE